ncbi:MAG: PEP-CTERM sorting domain-containing protein [Phycisphaerae bacterium]|jgi:hypothetical protein
MSFPCGLNRSGLFCSTLLGVAFVVASLPKSAIAAPVTVDLQYTAVVYAKAVAASDNHFPAPQMPQEIVSDFDANAVHATNASAAVAVHALVQAYEGWMLAPPEYGEMVWTPTPVVDYDQQISMSAAIDETATGILFSSAQALTETVGSHSIVDLPPGLSPPYDSPDYDQYRSDWWAFAFGTFELGIDEAGGYSEGMVVPLDLATSFAGQGAQWSWFVRVKRGDETIAELTPGNDVATINALAGETLSFEMGNLPEPATLSVLALGALGMLRWRRGEGFGQGHEDPLSPPG